MPIWINQVFEWIFSFIFFGTISNTGTIVETPQDWTQYLGIFKHLPIKNVQIYERWTTFLYFKTKIVLWIWIQNLWFGSGTREKPSGYTTHEITIFKYKMGDFCFWPKETMYQQLRFHFDFILSRFYLFKYCWTVLHHGECLPMVGRSLGHSSTLLLYDGTASSLFWFVRKLAIADFFRKLSWSIFIVC